MIDAPNDLGYCELLNASFSSTLSSGFRNKLRHMEN